jgi:DNA-binding beta-propeller fold protein YncE
MNGLRKSRGWLCLSVLFASAPMASAGSSIHTLAGAPEIAAHADGPGAQARFSDPAGLALDAVGNLLIADSANHCLRRLGLDGSVITLAGQPGQPGMDAAHLDSPTALVVAPDGTIFVADSGNHVIRRVVPGGRISTFAGKVGEPGAVNGTGGEARFHSPLGLALARDGSLVVADAGNHAIRRIAADTTVSTLAGDLGVWGTDDGPAAAARFNGPVGLAFDTAGNLLIADSANHTLRRFSTNGTVTTFAGKAGDDGCLDGSADRSRFCNPAGLAFDARGSLYVVDSSNHVLRRVKPDGTVSTVAGLAGSEGSTDGDLRVGRFFNPYGLVVTSAGSLVVSDTYNQILREVKLPFTLSVTRPAKGGVSISWESIPGRTYRLLTRDDLGTPWIPLSERKAVSTQSEATDESRSAKRFYQVVELP